MNDTIDTIDTHVNDTVKGLNGIHPVSIRGDRDRQSASCNSRVRFNLASRYSPDNGHCQSRSMRAPARAHPLQAQTVKSNYSLYGVAARARAPRVTRYGKCLYLSLCNRVLVDTVPVDTVVITDAMPEMSVNITQVM